MLNPRNARVIIHGNCQSQALETLTQHCFPEATVIKTKPLYLMDKSDVDLFHQQLKIADIIFSHPVQDDYNNLPVGTSQIFEAARTSATKLVIPNLYFLGYYPSFCYFPLNQMMFPHVYPKLPTYTCIILLSCYCLHFSVDKTFELLINDKNGLLQEYFKRICSESLDEFISREKKCDIKVSKFLLDEYKFHRLFFTFNHPSLLFLKYELQQMFDCPKSALNSFSSEFNYLAESRLPIYPSVVYHNSLDFDTIEYNPNIYLFIYNYFESLNQVFAVYSMDKLIENNSKLQDMMHILSH